jgi:Luciferase-like monooxygenase
LPGWRRRTDRRNNRELAVRGRSLFIGRLPERSNTEPPNALRLLSPHPRPDRYARRHSRPGEEFEALNSPAFNARGAVTDEWITIFRQLWSQSPASFNGRFYRYSDIHCEPFPVQKLHPPIWVGGHSRAALRRTARHGDGWHPVGAVAASPLPAQEMRAHLDTLKQLTEAERRDFSALTISYKAPLYDTGIPSNFRGYRRARVDLRFPRPVHYGEHRAPAVVRC